MRRVVSLIPAFVAFVALGVVHAQENRPAPDRAPQQAPTPAPAAERPAAAAPSPAMAQAIQQREERSVDLEELLARVSASSGKEFLVDPRVRARVFAVPQFGDPTYAELLTILRLHGYMAVELAGRVNIVPDANARAMPVRLVQRDDDSIPDDEWVTRIIEVPNAAQLVPILRPLLPQAAHLAATQSEEGDGSKLIIVDTYANVRRMTELVNALR
jgi:general secretion pathway protein D